MFDAAAWCDALPRAEYADLDRVFVQSGHAWFEVYDVGADVFALYEPNQFQEVISYLIVGQSRALLYDTGMGIASIRDVVSRLTELPVVVLNSHTHADHVGGNAEFDHVFGLDTDFTRASAAGLPNEVVAGQVAPDALCAPLPGDLEPDEYRIRPFQVTETLVAGETVDLGGRSLEVLAAPGHTPDAILLHDPESGLLFTGDSYYPGPIYLFSPETDWDAYRRSMTAAAALVPDLVRLHPGHNVAVSDPGALSRLVSAVQTIDDGTAAAAASEGARLRYDFDGFSILRPAVETAP
ncbi:MAG: MBL fold metallo-hydrolase [Gemmatimonadota bacterium]